MWFAYLFVLNFNDVSKMSNIKENAENSTSLKGSDTQHLAATVREVVAF